MRHPVLMAFAAVLAVACSRADGQARNSADMALNAAPARGQARLEVTSPAFAPGGDLPVTYSAFGRKASPPLSWTPGPAGTRSYAVIVQDPDAPAPKPFVHWVVFNIPAGVTAMAQNGVPAGAIQGLNSASAAEWYAVSPPAGPAHAYHFQVFALDTTLPLQSGAGRDQVVDAMKGHVLASGDLVGRYKVG